MAKCRQCRAVSVLVLLTYSALASTAAAQARRLKQVTFSVETPAVAGSTTVDVDANAALRPDGTVHAAAGLSAANSAGISNPLLNILTGGAYANTPKAETTAYTQIPLLLAQTIFPTLSYGSAKANGDLYSRSSGLWGNAEFGYNPLSNNLGASISAGTSDSNNIRSGESVGTLDPESGASDIAFAGYSNDLTNLADARTDQSGQATAAPANVANPVNPLTCTQVLLYAVTLTNYDLGAPYGPLPRENPASVVLYCLGLFNFGTLDDFANFVDERTDPNQPEQFVDNNRDGIIAGLDNIFPNGQVFNTNGNNNQARDTTTQSGIAAKIPPTGVAVAGENRAVDAAGKTPKGPRFEPGSKDSDRQQQLQHMMAPLAFSDAVNTYLKNAPEPVKIFAETSLGKTMLNQIREGELAKLADKNTAFMQNVTKNFISNWEGPLSKLTQAVTNATSAAIYGASNTAITGAVKALEAVQPVVGVFKGIQDSIQAFAKQSRDTATKLAQQSAKNLEATIDKLPPGVQQQARQAAAGAAQKQRSKQAQMGRRRIMH